MIQTLSLAAPPKTVRVVNCRYSTLVASLNQPLSQLGEQSVPKRGSVGSPFIVRPLHCNADPTLPRFGTDCSPRYAWHERQSI